MNSSRQFTLRAPGYRRAGSSLVIILGIIALAALLTATSIRVAAARYRNSHCSTSWNRAVFSAEGAADAAIMAIRQNNWTSTGWSGSPGVPGDPPVTKQIIVQNNPIECGATLNVDTVSMGGKHWYRIRALGWADLPGIPEAAPDKNDNTLRKLNLRSDRNTGMAISKPNVARIVEVLVEPVGPKPFKHALLARQLYDVTQNTVVDSFDSTDGAKSTGGLYDMAKRQHHGDVATLGTTPWDLHDAYIYGNTLSPTGALANGTNVQGNVEDMFAFSFPNLAVPSWSLIHQNFGAVSNTSVAADAGTAASPKRYKFDSIDLTDATGHIHFTLPAGETEGYVDVWVPNAVMVRNGGKITVDPGVRATFHFGTDATIEGAGIVNGTQLANHVTILGYGGNATFHPDIIIENSDFIGSVLGPWCDVTVNTPNRDVSGSFVAFSLDVRDSARMHYDEQLASLQLGETGDLRIRSWVEAVR